MNKIITTCALSALLAAGQVFAHTGIKDPALEGTASYNGLTTTHGCAAVGEATAPPKPGEQQQYPVLGVSALFPFGDNAVWRDAKGTVIQVGGNGNGTIGSDSLSLGVVGFAGFSSPFTTSQEIVDENGNVQALLWKDGAMEPKLNAITPFRVTAPVIANNCVRSLLIRIGAISYCDINKNAANDATGPYRQPKDAFGKRIPLLSIDGDVQTNVAGSKFFTTLPQGNGDNNRQDWWFTAPHGGSKLYTDKDLLQPDYWTTLTVKNSAADVAKCPAAKRVDVSVEPNGAAFDTYLNGANTQPFTSGAGNF